ncbi:MAG: ComEA family DNA-binding protein [Myxococcota bacterium]
MIGALLALIVLNSLWRILSPDGVASEEVAAPPGCDHGLIAVAWRHAGVRVGCLESLESLLEEAARGSGCSLQDWEDTESLSNLQAGDRVLVMPGEGEACRIQVEPIPGMERIALGIPIDVNSASRDDLMALTGIGPSLADAIVVDREERGPFRSVEELRRVRGIGPVRLQRLAEHVNALPPEGD